MKIFSWLILGAICAFSVSCEKPQSQADRDAQIQKEVQARLDAEHQAQEKDRLAQQQADLDAREKALATRETTTPAVATTTTRVTSERESTSEERAPQSYDTFYRKLEPYGAWRESTDYGYVWQPRSAQQSRNWRPYTDGRWAYTDAGWTWVSEEPFGWATYHYGRWTRLSEIGWVWVPGDEWAPAWVSWRTSDKNVGWAPLPPEARFEKRTGIKHWADNYYDIDAGEYVFVPNEDIGDENIQRAVLPEDRNVTIVNETTNVTNITYNNTMIVNEGPNFDQLRGRSRRPVERLRLQREYNVEREENPRSVVSGTTLQVITPFFAARATERPRTSAPPIQRATVERNRSDEFERARQKMKSEATPPPDAPSKKIEKPSVTESAPVASAAPIATATPSPAATVAATPRIAATASPVATLAPSPRPTVTATPVAASTPAPKNIATVTPLPVATVTPVTKPIATATPPPLATAAPTARTTPTPRPVASATVAPIATPPPSAATATPTPIATARPAFSARPIPASPVPRVTAPVAPTPADAAELELKRQEAREKAMKNYRNLQTTPTPAPGISPAAASTPVAAPRQVSTPRPLPTEATEGTPASTEGTPMPRRAPKRAPRALPPNTTPTPTPAP